MLLLAATVCQARPWYVDAAADVYLAGTRDGSTPAKAFSNLSYATDNAVSGDIIYISGGVYTPPPTNWSATPPLYSSFYIQSGVSLVGGYGGGVTQLLGRSGATFSVLQLREGNDTTRVSGITFPTYGHSSQPNSAGGAIDARGNVKLLVNNCTFATTTATLGGAINLANGAFAKVSGCEFAACKSGDKGGAIAVSSSTLVLQSCSLHDCSAQMGGALYTIGSNVLVEDTRFYGNKTTGTSNGGAVYVAAGTTLTMRHSSVVNQQANNGGGGLFISGVSTVTLDYCTVALNTSSTWASSGSGVGGNTSGNVSISNSIISGNTGGGGGNLDVNTIGVDLSNSLIDNKIYDDSGQQVGTCDRDDIDITVGDSGKVNVILPPTINTPNGEVDNPLADDSGQPTIGVDGDQSVAPQLALSMSTDNAAACAGQSVTFTLSATNLSAQATFSLYSVSGPSGSETLTLLRSQQLAASAVSFTLPMPEQSGATARFRGQVASGPASAYSADVLVVALPRAQAGKVNHGKNVVE